MTVGPNTETCHADSVGSDYIQINHATTASLSPLYTVTLIISSSCHLGYFRQLISIFQLNVDAREAEKNGNVSKFDQWVTQHICETGGIFLVCSGERLLVTGPSWRLSPCPLKKILEGYFKRDHRYPLVTLASVCSYGARGVEEHNN